MNFFADCRTTHGRIGKGVADRSAQRQSGCDERQLGEHQRQDHPSRVGFTERVGDRAESDLGELGYEQVDRETELPRSSGGPPRAYPVQRHEFRDLLARGLGRGRPE